MYLCDLVVQFIDRTEEHRKNYQLFKSIFELSSLHYILIDYHFKFDQGLTRRNKNRMRTETKISVKIIIL